MANPIIIGCNYHTSWQSNSKMRFILTKVIGDKAQLSTRMTHKEFLTDVSDLIYIHTKYNNRKARELGYKGEI